MEPGMNTMAAEARRKALCARLARVEGQVRGLQRLIEADTDPEKVAQQMAAARKALEGLLRHGRRADRRWAHGGRCHRRVAGAFRLISLPRAHRAL